MKGDQIYVTVAKLKKNNYIQVISSESLEQLDSLSDSSKVPYFSASPFIITESFLTMYMVSFIQKEEAYCIKTCNVEITILAATKMLNKKISSCIIQSQLQCIEIKSE